MSVRKPSLLSRFARLGLTVAVTLAGAALAQPARDVVAGALRDAQAAWKDRDGARTVRALEAALRGARAVAPLELRQAVVVHAPHTGLGLYTEAPGGVVVGRDLKLYVEVANLAELPTDAGAASALEVEADFSFEDTSPSPPEIVPLGTRALGVQRVVSRTPVGVTSFGLDVRLGDKSPPGTYRMLLRVKDLNRGGAAERPLTFVLR